LIKGLLKSLIILIAFVPVATCLPLAALSLCRTPDGAEFLFWVGPWSCCFWVLIYSQLSNVPWRQGADAVRQRRQEQGGLLVASAKATCWMFFGLLASYGAEGTLLFLTRSFAWLPAATFSPLAFCWVWGRCRCAR
jgi:hypothetical protein